MFTQVAIQDKITSDVFALIRNVISYRLVYHLHNLHFTDTESNIVASYSFQTAQLPSTGSCEIAPLEGIALVTLFSINCSGFDQHDDVLHYSYTNYPYPSVCCLFMSQNQITSNTFR